MNEWYIVDLNVWGPAYRTYGLKLVQRTGWHVRGEIKITQSRAEFKPILKLALL